MSYVSLSDMIQNYLNNNSYTTTTYVDSAKTSAISTAKAAIPTFSLSGTTLTITKSS